MNKGTCHCDYDLNDSEGETIMERDAEYALNLLHGQVYEFERHIDELILINSQTLSKDNSTDEDVGEDWMQTSLRISELVSEKLQPLQYGMRYILENLI